MVESFNLACVGDLAKLSRLVNENSPYTIKVIITSVWY